MAANRSTRDRTKTRKRKSPTRGQGGQGLDVHPSPKSEKRAVGGPGEQPPHDWPGREDRLRPKADHGEKSYVGAAKLTIPPSVLEHVPDP